MLVNLVGAPVDEVRTITSEKELASVFGEPKGDDTYVKETSKKEHFYSPRKLFKIWK